MTTAEKTTAANTASMLEVDPVLVNAVIEATRAGLEMAEIVPRAVGVSELVTVRHPLSVIVGLVGKHSGNVSLNLSESTMLMMAGALMGEECTEVNEVACDAIMEIGNILAGAIKGPLVGTDWEIRDISMPSIVLGECHSVLYTQGIKTVSVEFELPGVPFSAMEERWFSTSVSLLRVSNIR